MAQPNVISSQSPAASKITVGPDVRPEPGSAATAIATTPSPNAIMMNTPRNSERSSPYKPLMRPIVRPSPRKGVMSDTITLPPMRSMRAAARATSGYNGHRRPLPSVPVGAVRLLGSKYGKTVDNVNDQFPAATARDSGGSLLRPAGFPAVP